MANKKISELQSRTPALSDLMLVGDPSSGYSYKCTVTALATIIETDIADGYVTIGTTQTISGAKTFSNNLTLTSVVNTPTDPDKFLTLNASNVVTYRTGAEVLSDIGGVGGSGTTNYLPKFSATTTLANSQIFDNGTNIGIATATPDATARVQINKTDGYGLYLNYNTSTGSGVTTTALYAINTTASSGYAAVIEEKTPNTTAGQYPFVIKHSLSSGTAGVGFGTGVHFQLLDDAGTSKTTQLTIENIDAAAATYKTRYRFNVQNNGSSTPVVYINGTGLGVFTASPSVALDVTGEGKFSTINNATTDTDKFLVSDSGVLKYRTGAEVLSDIGGQGALTLTTSGSSGAATLVGNTLNIPNYGSALSGYVPYTGATTNVNLGTRYLQANYLVVDGQSNATGINFKQYSSVSFNGDGYTAMGPVSVDKMFFNFAQGSNIFKIFYFDVSGITGNATRAYTMPNSDGTLALTSQIPTVSGTTNYIPKFTSSSAIGNSQLVENGSTFYYDNGLGRYAIVNASAENTVSSYTTNANAYNDFVTRAATHQWRIANSEVMRLTSGGLLGLGTSAPSQKLSVFGGNLLVNNGVSPDANSGIRIVAPISTTQYNWMIAAQQNVNNGFEITPSTAAGGTTFSIPAFVVTSGGSIGIGTSAPLHPLDVINSGGTGISTRNAETNYSILRIGTDVSNGYAFIQSGNAGTGTILPLAFRFGSNERMRLDASGNLGLGTSSPYTASNYIFATTNGTNGSGYVTRVNGTTSMLVYSSASASTISEQRALPLVFETSGLERMRLDASGNLGLGVTPSAWRSIERALQIGATTSVTDVQNFAVFRNNNYVNSSGQEIYLTTNGASALVLAPSSEFRFLQAASGTAGNAISFTQAMTLDASGRLGIGVTSPDARVDVLGTNDTGDIVRIRKSSTGSRRGALGTESGIGYLELYDDGSAKTVRIIGNGASYITGGNVGIGTTSPARKFQVTNAADGFISRFTGGTSSDVNIGIFGSTGAFGSIGTESNHPFNLFTNGIDRISITTAGNVGIGTTSPSGQLHIKGASGLTNFGTQMLQVESSTDNYSGIVFSGTSGSNAAIRSEGASTMTFWTASGTSYTERMRITSGGNVGIGTTNPGQKLVVANTSADVVAQLIASSSGSSNIYFADGTTGDENYIGFLQYDHSSNSLRVGTSGNERMRITSGGNVGIGTTNPGRNLTVATSGESYISLTGGASSDVGYLFGTSASDAKGRLIYNNADNMQFWTASTERMRITSSGELLINTTSDAGDYKLQVNGAAYFANAAGVTNYTALTLANTTGAGSANVELMLSAAGNTGGVRLRANAPGANHNDFALYVTNAGTLQSTPGIFVQGSTNNTEFGGSIKTAAPSGGTAKPWKFGEAGVTLGGSNTSGVRVEIDGVVYYLVTGYLP